jgi:hypothetical protein
LFESSSGKQHVLRTTSGSPIFSERDALTGILRSRLGLLTEPVNAPLFAHFPTCAKSN